MKLLFIAKNIPTPQKKGNNIILTITEKLSLYHEIHILYPSEYIPFPLRRWKKYAPEYKLKSWKFNNNKIWVHKYWRIPLKDRAFQFIKYSTKQTIIEYIQEEKFDLIHAHYLYPDGLITHILNKKTQIPYCITIRKSDILLMKSIHKSSLTYKQGVNAIGNAKAILCLNQMSVEYCKKITQTKISLVPHGIDKLDISPTFPSSPAISVVASLIPLKRIDWVIKAYLSIKKPRPIPLKIIGNGPELNKLKALADNHPMIFFLGHLSRDEVLKELDQSNIFVLPSHNESFGLVYLEAAARGNAIIGTYNDGIYGNFDEGSEILYCKSYSDFRAKLEYLIHNPIKRIEIAQAANNKVKEFSWDKIIQQYNHIYNQ